MESALERRINPSIFQVIDAIGIYLHIGQMSYEAAKERAKLYTEIVGELPQMRRESGAVGAQAVGAGQENTLELSVRYLIESGNNPSYLNL